jgi:hypothetical protein
LGANRTSNHPELQKITIARDFGTEVDVHDGVKPGDQAILNPMVTWRKAARLRRASRRQARFSTEEAVRRLLFVAAVLVGRCDAMLRRSPLRAWQKSCRQPIVNRSNVRIAFLK